MGKKTKLFIVVSPLCLWPLAIFGFLSFTFIVHYEKQLFTFSNKLVYKQPITIKDLPPQKVILSNRNYSLNLDGKAVKESPGHLWFMKDGWLRPENTSIYRKSLWTPLWPEESDTDRIVEQLMFVPPNLDEITNNGTILKKILHYYGYGKYVPVTPGQHNFLKDNCPVRTCTLTEKIDEAATADAILFRGYFSTLKHKRFPSQVWILFLMESPLNSDTFEEEVERYRSVFNWTATYRHDSDIVSAYGKFISYDANVKYLPSRRNYAMNKTGKVTWFVSNCGAQNDRLNFAHQLSRYIEVDIYGRCGTKSCPRYESSECSQLLNTKYKFYLSFENSNCKDYITEKLFIHGLSHDIIPIVMGARKEDYLRVAPPNSFISIEDFNTVTELADYLKVLDKNDTLYNEYFRWRGTGEFINTRFWCRLCAMLHHKQHPKTYNDIDLWWNDPENCVERRWRSINASTW